MKKLIVIVTVVIWGGMAYAGSTAGTASAQFIKLGASAVSAGMGDTGVSLRDGDASAVYNNPAAVGWLSAKSVSLMYASLVEGMNYQYAAYAQPTGIGVFGAAVQYLSYGSIPQTDGTGLEIGTFSPTDTSVALSYAHGWRGVRLGASVKYISMKITNTATAYAIDFGAQKSLLNGRLGLGCAVQNLGSAVTFVNESDPLPMNIKAGADYALVKNMVTALEVNMPNDGDAYACAGAQYTHTMKASAAVIVRAGYTTRTKDLIGTKGFTCGLGARFRGYSADYAFMPMGELGNTHRVSLTARF
jgi:hypothetical protein